MLPGSGLVLVRNFLARVRKPSSGLAPVFCLATKCLPSEGREGEAALRWLLAFFDTIGSQAQVYFSQQVWSWGMAAQIAFIAGALLLARQASGAIRAWLTRQQAQYAQDPKAGADLATLLDFVKVIEAFIAFILVVTAYSIAGHFNWPRNELHAAGHVFDCPDPDAVIHRQDDQPRRGQDSIPPYLGLGLSGSLVLGNT